MGEDDQAMQTLFNRDLVKFLEKSGVQYIESNGEALMIFKYLHIMPVDEVQNMLDFSSELLDKLK